jgi:hypothetical protein
MSVGAERSVSKVARAQLGSRVLIGTAIVCLVLSGALLWARHGDTVFSDLVLAGLAWCF